MEITNSDRQGIRRPGGRISLVANTTALTVFTLGGTNRSAIPRKIHIMNNNPVAVNVFFGTGTAPFVQGDLPAFTCVAGFDRILTQEELVGWEAFANITCQADIAAAAPDEVQVSLECEVFQGT